MTPDGVHPVAAAGFDLSAADYERVRPSYPSEVADLLADELGLGEQSVVVDLAAGTGKLSRTLLDAGVNVLAVEPLDGMVRQLAAALPGVPGVRAIAELLPMRTASVDAVTVAQAFHWFDPLPALAEMARVLRPGGGVALIWNERDEGEPWLARLTEILRAAVDPPYATDVDYGDLLRASPGFTDVGQRLVRWSQPSSAQEVVDLVASRSYIATLAEGDRVAVLAEVAALVATLPERFEMPYVSRILWSRRLH